MPPDLAKVETLFQRACEVPAANRLDYLRAWCGDDRELLREVQSLLDALDAADSWQAPAREEALGPGSPLGPYRLQEKVGEGGMGAVFRAERVSGGFEQKVAVKIGGAPVPSGFLLRIFERERDALVRLDHPNIARLLDGGVSPGRQPYLVMEYIEGVPLDEYCRRQACGAREILGLMRQLCAAVSFSHRNLLLHLDLKPANVLVNAAGEVKLLDFGIARLLSPGAEPQGVPALTPVYASPEQAAGQALTAASDVYSLGVILYRLLAGRLPVEGGAWPAPTPPSQVEPEPEAPPRFGPWAENLDAIVLKALAADPAQRYGSADALAADLLACLEDRPLAARPHGARYLGALWLKRNRRGVAAGTLAALALGGALWGTWRAGVAAARQQLRAETATREVGRFARRLTVDFFDRLRDVQASTDAQRRLVRLGLRYLDLLDREEAGQDESIRRDALDASIKMGNLLGNPYETNLGEPKAARDVLGRALVRARQGAAGALPDRRDELLLARAERSVGQVHFLLGDLQQSLRHERAACALAESLAGRLRPSPEELLEAATCFDSLGDRHGLRGQASLGQPDQAIAFYQRAMDFHRLALAADAGAVVPRRSLGLELWKIARMQSERSPELAMATDREALRVLASLPPEAAASSRTVRLLALVQGDLGALLAGHGRLAEGMAMLEDVRERYTGLARRDPLNYQLWYNLHSFDYDLGQRYAAQGQWDRAAKYFAAVLAELEILLRNDPSNRVLLEHRAAALQERAAVLEKR